jgi:hypothetical protein
MHYRHARLTFLQSSSAALDSLCHFASHRSDLGAENAAEAVQELEAAVAAERGLAAVEVGTPLVPAAAGTGVEPHNLYASPQWEAVARTLSAAVVEAVDAVAEVAEHQVEPVASAVPGEAVKFALPCTPSQPKLNSKIQRQALQMLESEKRSKL